MNVYQKVLVRVYEETGGRDSKAVYLKDIVKELGFFPSYADIFSQMSHDGWITETSRSDEVNITPWGVRAAKNLQEGVEDNSRQVARAAKKLKSEVKELLVMTEELVGDVNEANMNAVEKKMSAVTAAVEGLKAEM